MGRPSDVSSEEIRIAHLTGHFEQFLQRRIKVGRLKLRIADGDWRDVGDGEGPAIAVSVDTAALVRLVRQPSSLGLGECWMDGSLRLEEGEIFDLVDLIARNSRFRPRPATWTRRLLLALDQRNTEHMARQNARHHYDLSLDLYSRFLDEDLQYSCAWFPTPGATLEDAQAAKRDRIARKLLLRPGDRVLDIGCGWGGLALDIAGREDVQVLGVTLAEEQQATAVRRAKTAGVSGRVRFSVTDYREVTGRFQRIVSIGMFEHVGRQNYDAYFKKIHDLLTPDGIALVHSICRRHGPGVTNPFLAKYIFPGGYIPLLSEVLPSVERAGLQVADIELWRRHYAWTLGHWRVRFAARRHEIAVLYDERFCRMWEYYLAISEVAFRWAGYSVFQMQLTRTIDAAPVTRAYVEG